VKLSTVGALAGATLLEGFGVLPPMSLPFRRPRRVAWQRARTALPSAARDRLRRSSCWLGLNDGAASARLVVAVASLRRRGAAALLAGALALPLML
jgi:hypothetical protein